MPTYGNGDLCSRLLCNAINRDYLERVQQCYSYASNGAGTCRRLPYIEKDGEFIRAFPPLGDAIRDVYDEACSSSNTPWKVSDHDRHTREIAGVGCQRLCAEDHTHEAAKNYYRRRQIGAHALWDVATETGEIATCVLVLKLTTVIAG